MTLSYSNFRFPRYGTAKMSYPPLKCNNHGETPCEPKLMKEIVFEMANKLAYMKQSPVGPWIRSSI